MRFIAFLIYLMSSTVAFATDVSLAKGQLYHEGSYSTQVLSIKNIGGKMLRTVWLECGFFREGVLLGAGTAFAHNVDPGQTAYVEVVSAHTEHSDSAECRVQGAD